MSVRISQLAIAGFRGATRPVVLKFDTSKAVVVIFGENGTGKSTIVDAIDFVTNGGLGQLAGRQATSAKEFLPALGAGSASLAVELTIDDQAWKARLLGAKPVLTPPEPARPVAHVLRRARILDLLAAKPGERYQQLSRFVAVPGAESAEEELRAAVQRTSTERETATAAIGQSQEQIEAYWVAEGKPGIEAIAWARELAARDPQALEKAAAEADQLLDRLARATVENERVDAAEKAAEDAATAVGEAKARLRRVEAEAENAEASLLELLEKAEAYVAAHPSLESCPVCERPIDRATLAERLSRRRDAGAAVDRLRRGVEAAAQRELGARRTLDAARADAWKVGARLIAAASTSRLKTVIALKIDWAAYAALGKPQAEEGAEKAAREAKALVAALDATAPTLRDAGKRAKEDVVRLRAARGLVASLDEGSIAAKEAELLLARLVAAQGIVESRRKAFVDEVLAAISKRVSKLYTKIHPGEEIGDITLATDPKKRASLDLSGRFNEACDIPPEGYYSESHLDTLGICVFMALAERSRAKDRPNLLVLDDVLTSVDGPHLERFVALVHDEAEQFSQVLLTTHYRHWFEAYRRGQGPAGHACLVELSHWSIDTGIRADRSVLPTDELAAALTKAPLDRQAIASRAGVILESLLTHLSICFKLRLAASKRHEHTLGELASAAPKKLRSVLKAEHDTASGTPESIELGAVLDALESLVPFRNWVGAHSNVLGDDVPNGQVLALGQAALHLAEAITCPSCGEMVGKRSGTNWRCRCGKARLTPLAMEGDDLPCEDVIP